MQQYKISFSLLGEGMDARTLVNKILFFEREFQLMASALDDSSLSSDQDTNQFLV